MCGCPFPCEDYPSCKKLWDEIFDQDEEPINPLPDMFMLQEMDLCNIKRHGQSNNK